MEKILTAFSTVIITFALPIQGALLLALCAVFIDTATGIYASKKRGEVFSSKKFSKVLPKALLFMVLIFLAHGVDIVFELDRAAVKVLTATILMVEGKSLDENVQSIWGFSLYDQAKEQILKAFKH